MKTEGFQNCLTGLLFTLYLYLIPRKPNFELSTKIQVIITDHEKIYALTFCSFTICGGM